MTGTKTKEIRIELGGDTDCLTVHGRWVLFRRFTNSSGQDRLWLANEHGGVLATTMEHFREIVKELEKED